MFQRACQWSPCQPPSGPTAAVGPLGNTERAGRKAEGIFAGHIFIFPLLESRQFCIMSRPHMFSAVGVALHPYPGVLLLLEALQYYSNYSNR